MHIAFCPDINIISNSILLFNVQSDNISPFIMKIPVFSELIVLIDIELIIGISLSLNSSEV